MWEPLSQADERYYKRLAAENKARAERRKRLEADMPRRRELLARVKAGEITFDEARRMIRKPNTPTSGEAEGAK
jgi:hypothetical protein